MPGKVFSISGNKIFSLFIDDASLQFSSKKFNSADDFKEAWGKKISLATKVEVKYDSIISVRKEDDHSAIMVRYRTWAGIPAVCQFSFFDTNDYSIFFSYLEKERYFTKRHEVMSPFKAAAGFAIGLIATIGFTIFTYYQAIEIANGTARESTSGKEDYLNTW